MSASRPLPSPQRVSPVTRITFPTCCAHYPGGSNECTCRSLPRPRGLPRFTGGSASANSLSRPAQALLALRPIELLNRHRGLCHEASTLPVARQSRSSATRPIDCYLGGFFLHWSSVPFRGTQRNPGAALPRGECPPGFRFFAQSGLRCHGWFTRQKSD